MVLLRVSIVILVVSIFSGLIFSGLIMTLTTSPSLSWDPRLATGSNDSDDTPPPPDDTTPPPDDTTPPPDDTTPPPDDTTPPPDDTTPPPDDTTPPPDDTTPPPDDTTPPPDDTPGGEPPTTEPTPSTNTTNATLVFGGYKIRTGWNEINFEKGCWTLEAIDGIFVYNVREGLDSCRVTSVYPNGTIETFQSFGGSDLVMVQGNTAHVEEGMSKSNEHVEVG